MTEKLQVYKCEICGNMASMVHSGAGDLVCCGAPMKLMVENYGGCGQGEACPGYREDCRGL